MERIANATTGVPSDPPLHDARPPLPVWSADTIVDAAGVRGQGRLKRPRRRSDGSALRRRRARGTTDRRLSECKNPNPPLTDERDLSNDRIPVTTWNDGPIFGGDNVPYAHRKKLATVVHRLSRRFLENVIVPFHHRQGVNSLRDYEKFVYNISRHWNLMFWRRRADGSEQLVDVYKAYDDRIQLFRRRLFDPVCREARCYFRVQHKHVSLVYPTTVPQLMWFVLMWDNCVIRSAVILHEAITQWRRDMQAHVRELRREQGKPPTHGIDSPPTPGQTIPEAPVVAAASRSTPATTTTRHQNGTVVISLGTKVAQSAKKRRISHTRPAASCCTIVTRPRPEDFVFQDRDCYEVVTLGPSADPDWTAYLARRADHPTARAAGGKDTEETDVAVPFASLTRDKAARLVRLASAVCVPAGSDDDDVLEIV